MEAIQSPLFAFVLAYSFEAARKRQLFSSAALGNGIQMAASVFLGRAVSRQFTAPSADLLSTRQLSSDAIAGLVYGLLRKVWGDKDEDMVSLESMSSNFAYGFGISLASSLLVPFVMPGLATFAGSRMTLEKATNYDNVMPTYNPGCGVTSFTQNACIWPSNLYSIYG